jgi:hypothetical protein
MLPHHLGIRAGDFYPDRQAPGRGEGWAWLEFDEEGWTTRRVERYGDRWFCSILDYHPDVGPCLCDQPLDQLELRPEEEITRDEFETAWQAALAHLGKS